MKKVLTLMAIIMMAVTVFAQANKPAKNIKEQVFTYNFQENNGNWAVGEGANASDGDITAPLLAGPEGELSLTAIQGTSTLPVRIMQNASKGIHMACYKGSSLKFNVAAGKAITKIEVVMQTGSFDMVPSNGEVADNVWTGNASQVVFTNAKGTRYIWAISVTVANRNDETVDPVATTAMFDFASPDFRENIGTALTDVAGYIYNETFTADGATLQITAGSVPSRIYVDNNRGQNLVLYKEYATLTFHAPAGKAITKIEFTAAGNSNINNFTASSGTIEGMVWTGNAEGVRFMQGGTSYLANAILTLEDIAAESYILPAIEYTSCADIAAFNALEAGSYAKVTLTGAEVIGKSADGYSTVWIQDATGGCWIQYTSLNSRLTEGTKFNGTFYVAKRMTSGNPQMKEAEKTPMSTINNEETIDEYTIIEGSTIADINIAENLNRVVKLTGGTFVATSATAGTLTIGDESITVNNGNETANQLLHKITDTWVKEETVIENVTIVAILSAASATKNQLLPISMIEGTIDGITAIENGQENAVVYNLQGVRMNQVQKGLNIVNGKKFFVK